MATDALLVLTTLGSSGDARVLVRGLVEDRLIACGTMVPAASIYRWEGAVHEEEEGRDNTRPPKRIPAWRRP